MPIQDTASLPVPLAWYLILATVLFTIGVVGVLRVLGVLRALSALLGRRGARGGLRGLRGVRGRRRALRGRPGVRGRLGLRALLGVGLVVALGLAAVPGSRGRLALRRVRLGIGTGIRLGVRLGARLGVRRRIGLGIRRALRRTSGRPVAALTSGGVLDLRTACFRLSGRRIFRPLGVRLASVVRRTGFGHVRSSGTLRRAHRHRIGRITRFFRSTRIAGST